MGGLDVRPVERHVELLALSARELHELCGGHGCALGRRAVAPRLQLPAARKAHASDAGVRRLHPDDADRCVHARARRHAASLLAVLHDAEASSRYPTTLEWERGSAATEPSRSTEKATRSHSDPVKLPVTSRTAPSTTGLIAPIV